MSGIFFIAMSFPCVMLVNVFFICNLRPGEFKKGKIYDPDGWCHWRYCRVLAEKSSDRSLGTETSKETSILLAY